MKIRHESPAPDVELKVSAALFLETPQRETIRIERWSLARLQWPEEAPPCPKTGTLSVPFQGVDIRFPVRMGEPDRDRMISLEGLSGRQRETLALFYRSLLSGRMASSGDVITSLDTPLDLVPMEETEAEKVQKTVGSAPRYLRAVVNVASYLLIAVAVIGIVGNNIFTNLDRIDIQHGRVLAPMADVLATGNGFVKSVEIVPGQEVRAGDVLMRLEDPAIKARLDKAEADLAAAENAYARIIEGLRDLDATRSLDNAAARMAVASRLHSRFIGTGGFDEIRRQWITLRDQGGDGAAEYDPIEIVYEMLSAEAQIFEADLLALRAERDAQFDLMDANHIVAATDGLVQDILVQPGQFLRPQQTAITLEATDPRVMVGWVSERFAETIYIGMPATIGLNENGERVKIRGAVFDVRAGDHPERPGEFGIVVTVTATGLTAEDTKTRLRVGAPVNLDAKRLLAKRLKDWLSGKVEKHG